MSDPDRSALQDHGGESLVVPESSRPMVVCDPQTHEIVAANEAACVLYGYPRSELIELRLEDLGPPEDVSVLHERLEALSPDQVVHRRGVRHRHRSGEELLVALEVYPLHVGGRTLRLVQIEKADGSGATASERYALLFRGMREGAIFMDAEGVITDWNPAAERIWGYSREVAIGRHSSFLYPAAEGDHAAEILSAVERDGRWEGYLESKAADDSTRYCAVRVLPIRNQREEIVGTVAINRDLTEQRRVERALMESKDAIRQREEYFRSVFEYAHDAIVLFDLETGRVLDANPEAESLYGYDRDSFTERSLDDLYANLDALREWLEEVERGGHGSRVLDQVDADGAIIHAESNAALMRHRDRPVLLTVNRDLTERQRTEARLKQVERMEALARLAGGLAHDFNNLTTAIQGFADLLRDRIGADPEAQDALEEIDDAARRGAELTRQLLASTRQQVMRGAVLDLNEVVTSSRPLVESVLGEDVEVELDLETPLEAVRADAGRLKQMLIDLAINAGEAMPDGGRLTVQTRNIVLDREFTESHPPTEPGEYVRIRVTDTGSGMSEEIQSHAFDPFFTTKEVGEGTGLGLATVYGIVKQSGGYIWVESEPGVGTQFDIYLPRVEGSEPAGVERSGEVGGSTAEGPGRSGARILLVEDEDAVRKLSRKVLERAGFSVLEAEDGEAAWALVEAESPQIDLVLTDMVMPGLGGKQLARRLRKVWPDTPILFMTGYTGEDFAGRHDLHRTETVLEKPFKPAELVEAVERMIPSA